MTTAVSQQRAPERHKPKTCGFERCKEYVQRFYYVRYDNRYMPVVWESGDAEDILVWRIHAHELRMRDLSDLLTQYREWEAQARKRDKILEQLRCKLKARLEDSGKVILFEKVDEYLLSIDFDREKFIKDMRFVFAERQRWERIHGRDVARSTRFVIRSLPVD